MKKEASKSFFPAIARAACPALFALALGLFAPVCNAEPAPFDVKAGLFDAGQPDSLGLDYSPGAETITVFRPIAGNASYNHGAVLTPFQGNLYAQWQSSDRDEDAPDTHVLYAKSRDGREWSQPIVLSEGPANDIRTSGGWWSNGEILVAFINEWQQRGNGPRQGRVLFMLSKDGNDWSRPQPVLDNRSQPVKGIIEQDPHLLPGGRIVTAFHEQPGLKLTPRFTDDPSGIRGWTRGHMANLPFKGPVSRELEPSWFLSSDASLVMVMRDQGSSFRTLASISHDRGETWSVPVLTDMPDSRSKQCAGNLPSGAAYLVGNPTGGKRRYPLVVTLSQDGKHFDRAFLLRAGGQDLQAMRHEGKYKRPGFSYPKSLVWNCYLYVSYTTNKEDVEITRIPLNSLDMMEAKS